MGNNPLFFLRPAITAKVLSRKRPPARPSSRGYGALASVVTSGYSDGKDRSPRRSFSLLFEEMSCL